MLPLPVRTALRVSSPSGLVPKSTVDEFERMRSLGTDYRSPVYGLQDKRSVAHIFGQDELLAIGAIHAVSSWISSNESEVVRIREGAWELAARQAEEEGTVWTPRIDAMFSRWNPVMARREYAPGILEAWTRRMSERVDAVAMIMATIPWKAAKDMIAGAETQSLWDALGRVAANIDSTTFSEALRESNPGFLHGLIENPGATEEHLVKAFLQAVGVEGPDPEIAHPDEATRARIIGDALARKFGGLPETASKPLLDPARSLAALTITAR